MPNLIKIEGLPGRNEIMLNTPNFKINPLAVRAGEGRAVRAFQGSPLIANPSHALDPMGNLKLWGGLNDFKLIQAAASDPNLSQETRALLEGGLEVWNRSGFLGSTEFEVHRLPTGQVWPGFHESQSATFKKAILRGDGQVEITFDMNRSTFGLTMTEADAEAWGILSGGVPVTEKDLANVSFFMKPKEFAGQTYFVRGTSEPAASQGALAVFGNSPRGISSGYGLNFEKVLQIQQSVKETLIGIFSVGQARRYAYPHDFSKSTTLTFDLNTGEVLDPSSASGYTPADQFQIAVRINPDGNRISLEPGTAHVLDDLSRQPEFQTPARQNLLAALRGLDGQRIVDGNASTGAVRGQLTAGDRVEVLPDLPKGHVDRMIGTLQAYPDGVHHGGITMMVTSSLASDLIPSVYEGTIYLSKDGSVVGSSLAMPMGLARGTIRGQGLEGGTPVRAILDGRGVPIFLQPRRELNPRQQAALLGLWTQTEAARAEALNAHPYIVDIVENTKTGQTIESLMSSIDHLPHSSGSWTRDGEISVIWDADKSTYAFVAGRRSDAYAVVSVHSNPGHLLISGGGDFHYEVVVNRLNPEASSYIQNILNFAQMRVNGPSI